MKLTLPGYLVFLVLALLWLAFVAGLARGEEPPALWYDPPPIKYDAPPAGRPGPARTQAQPALTIQWTGTDPAGWHRHRNPRTGKIVAHRTHLDRWGRMVGSDAEHTIDGDLCRGLYTGPLPPTEIPLDYPLIVRDMARPSATWRDLAPPACPPGQP